jgi:hypothetical protein
MNTRRLKPSALPDLESASHHSWREGWFQGIAVGAVIGFALALAFFHR